MRLFRWLSAKSIPPSCDLRRFGWSLVETTAGDDAAHRYPALTLAGVMNEPDWSDLGEWRFSPLRKLILLIGIDDETARARLLRQGFGDVTGNSTNLHEIEARALRITAQAESLPRLRRLGPLQLDLFARDGFAFGKRLGLHPREFAVIWRLSDCPGEAVAKKVLIRDVWRMAYVPETNSLAVHVYRLRAKLASVGLEWMVQTTEDGCYRFEAGAAIQPASAFSFAEDQGVEDKPLELSVFQGLVKEKPA